MTEHVIHTTTNSDPESEEREKESFSLTGIPPEPESPSNTG